MHITEGIVTGVPAAASAGVAIVIMGIGARKMQAFVREHPARKPLLGMAGAFIFFLSLIPIPAFTGTCSHPCGSPLAGILLGPWIGAALSGLSLLLQAAFFAHGGFSTWGLNLITLGVGGAVFGWLAFYLARRAGLPLWLSGALGGLIGDVMTYVIAGLLLSGALVTGEHAQYSFTGYLTVIYSAYLPTQGPIAIGEMLLTGLALHYIYQQRPEVLESLKVMAPRKKLATATVATLLLLMAMLLPSATAASSPQATGHLVAQQAQQDDKPAPFTGMDEAVNEAMAEKAGRPPRDPYINTESYADLWNAIMLLAGGVCGFIIGRYWPLLFGRKKDELIDASVSPGDR
ncbi:MAG: energy-coupling factor ABC transporter permease [Armatimonadota bacterium]